jgi:transcriptional regulator with XRE-family HTH domain
LKSKQDIQQAFDGIFSHEDRQDEIKHRSKMLMFSFLSEVEKIAEERNLKKKDIAKIIGTSPSYVTQLFRGDKLINLETLAKLEKALDFEFAITIKPKNQAKSIKRQGDDAVINKPGTKKSQKKVEATSS